MHTSMVRLHVHLNKCDMFKIIKVSDDFWMFLHISVDWCADWSSSCCVTHKCYYIFVVQKIPSKYVCQTLKGT